MSLFLPGKKEQVIEIKFSEDGEGDLFSPLLWIPFPTPSQELATMFELFTPFLIFPTPRHPTSYLEKKKKLFKISASRIQNPTHPCLWQKTAHYAFPSSYKPRFSSLVISLLKVIYACDSALSSLISFAHLVFRCCLWFYSYPPPAQQRDFSVLSSLNPISFPTAWPAPSPPRKALFPSLPFSLSHFSGCSAPIFLAGHPPSLIVVFEFFLYLDFFLYYYIIFPKWISMYTIICQTVHWFPLMFYSLLKMHTFSSLYWCQISYFNYPLFDNNVSRSIPK